MKIKVNQREFDTILAALRYWQATAANGEWDMIDPFLIALAENGREGDDAALLVPEIDALCERINTRS